MYSKRIRALGYFIYECNKHKTIDMNMFFATAAEQRDKILIVDIHNLKEHQDELLSIEFQLMQQQTEKNCNLKI